MERERLTYKAAYLRKNKRTEYPNWYFTSSLPGVPFRASLPVCTIWQGGPSAASQPALPHPPLCLPPSCACSLKSPGTPFIKTSIPPFFPQLAASVHCLRIPGPVAQTVCQGPGGHPPRSHRHERSEPRRTFQIRKWGRLLFI